MNDAAILLSKAEKAAESARTLLLQGISRAQRTVPTMLASMRQGRHSLILESCRKLSNRTVR